MGNLDIKKQELKILKENIQNCSDKIFTLKLAIKGLVGNLPEFVTDKLIKIAGDISLEKNTLEFYERQLKDLVEENE